MVLVVASAESLPRLVDFDFPTWLTPGVSEHASVVVEADLVAAVAVLVVVLADQATASSAAA